MAGAVPKSNKRWQRMKAKHKSHKHKCLNCGKVFYGYSYQKYCRYSCQREFWIKQQEEGKYKPSWLKIRIKVFDRDGFQCQYCGRNPREDDVKLQVEHINPRSNGGDCKMENLLTACEDCNYGKGDYCLKKFRN